MYDVKFKLIELKERYAKFEISGITPAIANMIRRTLIADIPKLAIHKVEFHHGQIRDSNGNVYDSSTPLFDEIIAHRLGLVPLPTDLKLNFRESCSCGGVGCPNCTVMYSLHKLGPNMVYSGDLIPVGDKDLRPIDPLIPIVKLKEGQAILVYAEAILGTAKKHAKWQVTHGVSYKYHREISVRKDMCEYWESVKKACPQCVVYEDEEKIVFTDDYNCEELAKIVSYCECEVKEDDTRFIFQFETDGSLSAEETLRVAFKVLKERLEKLRESASLG